jgi:hypothetical protein
MRVKDATTYNGGMLFFDLYFRPANIAVFLLKGGCKSDLVSIIYIPNGVLYRQPVMRQAARFSFALPRLNKHSFLFEWIWRMVGFSACI